MFTKFFRRNRTTIALITPEVEQQMLDTLRYLNADNQQMQLHLDRMQTTMGGAMRAI